jgi:hypothetical protein
MIEIEIERCLALGDRSGGAHWRRIASAVEQLRQ